MYNIGLISYASAAVVFFVGVLCILFFWRTRQHSIEFVMVMLVGGLWAGLGVYTVYGNFIFNIWLVTLELILHLIWFFVLIRLLQSTGTEKIRSEGFAIVVKLAYGLPLVLLGLLLYVSTGEAVNNAWLGYDLRMFGQVAISIIGIILTEQLFRHRSEQRWAYKFTCFGFAAFFIYNFYLYSEALMFNAMSEDAWSARGFVVAFAALLMIFGVKRFSLSDTHISISRPFVFYSAGLFIAGIYLSIIAAGGYYLKVFGGDWGVVASNSFVFVAIIILLIIIFSGHMRARLRVFIDKHLLNYKYDYRTEWLKIIRQLSSEQDISRLEEKSLIALADIVDSPSGGLWISQDAGRYENVQTFGSFRQQGESEGVSGDLVCYLEQWQWVINLEEIQNEPELYQELKLPKWLESADLWLVIPLMLQAKLYGFVVLSKPRAAKEFNWEDIDLLKTAGRQIALYIAHARSARSLMEARQFEVFNRFSAYVVHDLKNILSQLGLLVKNAKKHKTNPAFVDDMVSTVENSVSRMDKLLVQLKKGEAQSQEIQAFNVYPALKSVISDKSNALPIPELQVTDENIYIKADRDRFISIMGHLVQNAQEATLSNGYVKLRLSKLDSYVVISVEDNGSGMDEQFIKERLFRPFDSTKGLTGMGIGAHDAKQYIESVGGSIALDSLRNRGSTFTIRIPLMGE